MRNHKVSHLYLNPFLGTPLTTADQQETFEITTPYLGVYILNKYLVVKSIILFSGATIMPTTVRPTCLWGDC